MNLVIIPTRGKVTTKIKSRLESHNFDVGILADKPYKKPKSKLEGLKAYSGMPSRKTGKVSGVSISKIAEYSFNRVGHNYILRPFRRMDSDISRFLQAYVKEFWKDNPKPNYKRLENLIQAVVRNPIFESKYGVNKPSTEKRKGFNKLLIDTAQLFRAIRAKVHVQGKTK